MIVAGVTEHGGAWICIRDRKEHRGKVILNSWTRLSCGGCSVPRYKGCVLMTSIRYERPFDYPQWKALDIPEEWKKISEKTEEEEDAALARPRTGAASGDADTKEDRLGYPAEETEKACRSMFFS